MCVFSIQREGDSYGNRESNSIAIVLRLKAHPRTVGMIRDKEEITSDCLIAAYQCMSMSVSVCVLLLCLDASLLIFYIPAPHDSTCAISE